MSKDEKHSCKCACIHESQPVNGPPLTYFTLDSFKFFFKLIWEPFEAQFGDIEACFSNHTIAAVRLANVDYQKRALEYQNQVVELLEEQKRQGKYYF